MSETANTRRIIAQSFKELMMKKSFEKITVADITSNCGFNRQTFYYHFKDKYDLLNQIFYNEIICELTNGMTLTNWSDKCLVMLKTMKKDEKFYKNATKSANSEEFRNYIFAVYRDLFYDVIGRLAEEYTLRSFDRAFVSRFFAFGVAGTIIDWVENGMKESAESLTAHMTTIIDDCKSLVINRYMYNAPSQNR